MQKGIIPIPLVIITLLITIIGGSFYFKGFVNKQSVSQPSPSPQLVISTSPNPTEPATGKPTSIPKSTPKTSPSQSPKSSPKPSPTPTTKPTSTPKPTPTPQPTPKKLTCNISSFAGGKDPLSVGLSYSDINLSGSNYATGLKWDFDNDGNWDSETIAGTIDHTFSKEGSHTIRLQVKISDGSFTDICTKTISVPQGINVTLSGQVYSDNNCSDSKDPGEGGVAGLSMDIEKLPERDKWDTVTSDSNGNYKFSRNIQSDYSLNVEPYFVAPTGYKIHKWAGSVILNSSNKSVTLDIPLVPAEVSGSCPIP